MLEHHLARSPVDVPARHLLAVVRRGLSDPIGAEEALAPILGLANASIHHVAGLIARDRGDLDVARLRLRRSLICNPGHAGAWQALTRLAAWGGAGALRAAAAAALSEPKDLFGWRRLWATSLAVAEADRAAVGRGLIGEAFARSNAFTRSSLEAVPLLFADWSKAGAAPPVETDLEAGLIRLVEQIAGRLQGESDALAGLDRQTRRLALWWPDRRWAWVARMAMHGFGTAPGAGRNLRNARQVLAFGGMHRTLPNATRLFEAAVEAKASAFRSQGKAAPVVGHALGMQALCETVGQPIALRWVDRQVRVRIGDREIGYGLASPQVTGFVTQLFLHEPGLWRWMAGFGPDDVLLDVGANVGIYSIAAAGLFGVRVVALEPYRPNLEALRANVEANRLADRIAVLPIAATETETTGRLFHEGGAAGAAAQRFGVDAPEVPAEEPFDRVDGIPVDLLVERGTILFPTRIKIDVDGNERAVIEGMTRTLADRRLHSVRLELRWWKPDGRAVAQRVCSFGFRAAVDDDQKNLLFTRP